MFDRCYIDRLQDDPLGVGGVMWVSANFGGVSEFGLPNRHRGVVLASFMHCALLLRRSVSGGF